LSFVIRELERERGVRRVERADAGGDATAPEPQAVPGGLGPHAHDHPAERERVDPLAAVRVLVVDETVAVVVDAVTADLGGAAGYRPAPVAARPARFGAAGDGPPVVARAARAGSRAAGGAAVDRVRLTRAGDARVGRAGVAVVTVGGRVAGAAPRDRGQLAG